HPRGHRAGRVVVRDRREDDRDATAAGGVENGARPVEGLRHLCTERADRVGEAATEVHNHERRSGAEGEATGEPSGAVRGLHVRKGRAVSGVHGITSPEFGPSVCPTYRLPPGSLASRTAGGATSAGTPNRPSGSSARLAAFHSPLMPATIGVSTGPGAMALTSTPRSATSSASALVRPMTPAFAAL